MRRIIYEFRVFYRVYSSKAWESAEQIDQLLEVKLDFAFDEEKGYLTTCPTNVGDRVSVLQSWFIYRP